MNDKKYFLIATGIICLFLFVFTSNSSAQSMFVKRLNGNENSFILDNISKLTFSENSLLVNTYNDGIEEFILDSLQHISFANTVDIAEISGGNFSEDIIVYPNPFNNILKISVIDDKFVPANIGIFNLSGKPIVERHIERVGLIEFNLIKLTKGIYVCRITNNNQTKSFKLIKQ